MNYIACFGYAIEQQFVLCIITIEKIVRFTKLFQKRVSK